MAKFATWQVEAERLQGAIATGDSAAVADAMGAYPGSDSELSSVEVVQGEDTQPEAHAVPEASDPGDVDTCIMALAVTDARDPDDVDMGVYPEPDAKDPPSAR